jgi:pimeloyl-ACP methyl ester carboxylesterase
MLSKKIYLLLIGTICFRMLLYSQTGYGITVRKSGSGKQSIIFIPGLSCSGTVWDSTKQKLKKKYTCYVLTLPGFAGVPAQSDPSFKNFEKAIADYIIGNHISKPIIIGHSLGGSLAMALASDYPDLASKIIAVDALPFLLAFNDSTAKANALDCDQEIAELIALTKEEFYKLQKQSAWRFVSDTAGQKNMVDWAIRSDRKTFAKLYCDLTNTDLREQLSAVTCPALVLLQPYFSDSQAAVATQFKNLKQVKIVYSTRGLHFIMYDNYNWYMEQVISFLKE